MENKAKGKDDEINKAILEWLISKKFDTTATAFLVDANLKMEQASKGNSLEKRWNTLLTMQKKISDLETQVKQLKEDCERAAIGGVNIMSKKENESMVNKHFIMI